MLTLATVRRVYGIRCCEMERAPYLIIASCLGLSPFLGSPCQRRQRPCLIALQRKPLCMLLGLGSQPPQTEPWEMRPFNIPLQIVRHSTFSFFGAILYRFHIYILCKTAVTNWYNSYASLFMRPKMHRSCLGKPAWHRKVQGVPRKIPFWCALAPHNLTMRPNHAWSASMRFEELAKGDAAAAAESRKAKSYNRLNVAGLLKKPPPAHE